MARFPAFFAVVIVAVTGAARAAAPAQEPREDDDVSGLINALSNPDPDARAAAAETLRAMTERARPALVQAARSDDLTLATAAGELLVTMPWYRPDDPQAVRTALLPYANLEVAARIEVVGRIAAEYPRPVANAVLPRLLVEEPSEDVCWHVVAALRRTMTERTRLKLREIEVDEGKQNRASSLVTCARAWFNDDPRKARELLRRAVDIETRAPTYDDGELDFAFDVLAAADEAAGRYDAAAQLRRAHSSRVGVQRTSYASPVFQLFALHARFGPLEGFAADVQTYAVYLGEPQVLYALAQTYARAGDGFSSNLFERAAATASLRPGQRLRVADYLRGHGWNDLAGQELLRIVASEPVAESAVDQVNARLRLAAIARDRTDDRAVADHLRIALKLIETNGLRLERTGDDGARAPFEPNELRAEIAWHEFRAARCGAPGAAPNAAAAAEEHLAELLALRPTTSRVVIDAVAHLKSVGREADAQRLFNHAYAVARKRLDNAPDDPNLMNELAWLCARCRERLDEALELATRATAISPANASHLDTAAEANFQVARIEEAVRLEKMALELDPSSTFFREQLARFERARRP
jgi:tetratricopeptide (TPR) repeat protein